MKLNRRKIHLIIRQKQEGASSREIKHIEISRRRVNQIWKYFIEHGREPIIGKGVGRPRKPYIFLYLAFPRHQWNGNEVKNSCGGLIPRT
jgi:hypothetical protein